VRERLRNQYGTLIRIGKVRHTNCHKKSPVEDAFYVRVGCCPGDVPKRSAGPTWAKSGVEGQTGRGALNVVYIYH